MRQSVAKSLDILVKRAEIKQRPSMNISREQKRIWNRMSHIERGKRRYTMDLATGKKRMFA